MAAAIRPHFGFSGPQSFHNPWFFNHVDIIPSEVNPPGENFPKVETPPPETAPAEAPKFDPEKPYKLEGTWFPFNKENHPKKVIHSGHTYNFHSVQNGANGATSIIYQLPGQCNYVAVDLNGKAEDRVVGKRDVRVQTGTKQVERARIRMGGYQMNYQMMPYFMGSFSGSFGLGNQMHFGMGQFPGQFPGQLPGMHHNMPHPGMVMNRPHFGQFQGQFSGQFMGGFMPQFAGYSHFGFEIPLYDKVPVYGTKQEDILQKQYEGKIRGWVSPLALDLDGDGLETTGIQKTFDLNGDGRLDRTAWVGKREGLLAFDADGDGKVGTSGRELLGNNTDVAGSGKAGNFANGYEALRALAAQHLGEASVADGKLDASEIKALENKVKLRLIIGDQSKTLSETGVSELNLNYQNVDSKDARFFDRHGNQHRQTADFVINGQRRQSTDVWFKSDLG
ncbi:MAG: hypothetical protein K2X01_11220 [Cyanobacteria bacterium]|nr:hypothetical protein [Cyanobacteriota bacterium]